MLKQIELDRNEAHVNTMILALFFKEVYVCTDMPRYYNIGVADFTTLLDDLSILLVRTVGMWV